MKIGMRLWLWGRKMSSAIASFRFRKILRGKKPLWGCTMIMNVAPAVLPSARDFEAMRLEACLKNAFDLLGARVVIVEGENGGVSRIVEKQKNRPIAFVTMRFSVRSEVRSVVMRRHFMRLAPRGSTGGEKRLCRVYNITMYVHSASRKFLGSVMLSELYSVKAGGAMLQIEGALAHASMRLARYFYVIKRQDGERAIRLLRDVMRRAA